MTRMATSSRGFLLVLVVLLVPCHSNNKSTICDDGKYEIVKDLGVASSHKCPTGSRYAPQFVIPAGEGRCTEPEAEIQPLWCMDQDLKYRDSPPTHGHYRPLPPMAGEYEYLPPQRWLHLLKRGGVAFLYHPCADEEQVEELITVAQSCLNNYVMTPYPDLTKEKPLAVVTWGCVYSMEWVQPTEIKDWLMDKQLKLDDDSGGASYSHGLRTPYKAKQIKTLCPLIHTNSDDVTTTTPSTATSPPPMASPCLPRSSNRSRSMDEEQLCVKQQVQQSLQRHSTSLLALSVLLGVVLLGFLLLIVWKGAITWSRSRPKKYQKYKSVSKYFPFSHRQDSSVDVVLPELGMPKGMGAERQVLLGDSEDDEL